MARSRPAFQNPMSMPVETFAVASALSRRQNNGFMHPVDEQLLARSASGLRDTADRVARGDMPAADTKRLRIVFQVDFDADLVAALRRHADLLDIADDDHKVDAVLAAFQRLVNGSLDQSTISEFETVAS